MSKDQIIECVPNFSEGRNPEVIEAIAAEIRGTDGVKLLNVDPGKATNRTVMTFAGAPEDVVEAAFRAIKKAAQLIDMSKHSGEHPRMGATDVCPLVPVRNITMEETVEYARQLAKRVGEEASVPVYLYEYAATSEQRRNLAVVREGEYEGLEQKMQRSEWKPDFGPGKFNSHTGATVIGARDFLVAYNINLNTNSTRLANAIAFDVREQGRVKRIGDPITGEVVKDEQGNTVRIPGTLKHVKAIGWFIEEYGTTQISMNLTNIRETPLHIAFEEVTKSAESRGVRITGSELVGMVPKSVLVDAGKFYLAKQHRSAGIPEKEIIDIAIRTLGLNEISGFKPEERIIEYMLEGQQGELARLSITDFAYKTASESPAPGGGSVAAAIGAFGVALGTMVANLSANKRGWESKIEQFSDAAVEGQELVDQLLELVDEDTRAFNKVMAALGMAKGSEEEQKSRKAALDAANVYAAEVPLKVMETAMRAFPLMERMAAEGNPASVTDAGVGALAVHTCIEGAWMNVLTNLTGMKGSKAEEIRQKANKIAQEAQIRRDKVRGTVLAALNA